jgi:hypothetical protein
MPLRTLLSDAVKLCCRGCYFSFVRGSNTIRQNGPASGSLDPVLASAIIDLTATLVYPKFLAGLARHLK